MMMRMSSAAIADTVVVVAVTVAAAADGDEICNITGVVDGEAFFKNQNTLQMCVVHFRIWLDMSNTKKIIL